ncbi:MAG: dockerin type I domain-containing protein [Phycisphaerae bacterium]
MSTSRGEGHIKSTDGGQTWISNNIGGGQIDLFDVDFIDANRGWVAGPSGFIMRTVDGGVTWNLINVPIGSGQGSHSKFDSRFIDANVGWLIGNFGYALKTTDGGITRTPEPTGFENDSTVGFDSIFAAPSGDIWVSGTSGIILKRPAALVLGDINGDGVADINDVPVFAAVLVGTDTDPNRVAAADMNNDGNADGLDVQPFANVLVP